MFLVDQSFAGALPIFHKIGFEALTSQPVHQKGLGVPVILTVFNLARRAVSELDSNHMAGQLRETMNAYLAERYVKRQALRGLFHRRVAWQHFQ